MTKYDETAIIKLTKDLKNASKVLSKHEARFLVDTYYIIQNWRISSANQGRILEKNGEPHEVIDWIFDNSSILENQIKRALDAYTDFSHMGKWAKSICGIGPVISAGLDAHIDISKAPTVGHIWNFAGLNPEIVWEKKSKRPWNASLKTLCWKLGESFVKVSNNEKDIYGKIYKKRKKYEDENNRYLQYADQAKAKLEKYKIKSREALRIYGSGMLPQGHIHARAKRYAVKLFLSHWHHEAYLNYYGEEPPKPYPIAILGHAHEITFEDLLNKNTKEKVKEII